MVPQSTLASRHQTDGVRSRNKGRGLSEKEAPRAAPGRPKRHVDEEAGETMGRRCSPGLKEQLGSASVALVSSVRLDGDEARSFIEGHKRGSARWHGGMAGVLWWWWWWCGIQEPKSPCTNYCAHVPRNPT